MSEAVTAEPDRATADALEEPPRTLLDIEPLRTLLARVHEAPTPRFLCRGVMAEGDYGMLGAEDKAGKTWLVTDLAVSVASGTPWLGLFPVDSPGPVLVFAGEGGARKIARRFQAVCEAKGLDPRSLPIRICLRVPHLTSDGALLLVEEEIATTTPRLGIIDPLYLAARGARGSDLYEMGAHLVGVQEVCQRHGAGLLITTHWNKTGQGTGAKRFTGVGPGAWGRVLISAAVISRHTDPVTKATTVALELEFQGDEIGDQRVRIRRRVWAHDPDDLASLLHYEVTRVDDDTAADPALAGLRPSSKRVLRALEAAQAPLTVKGLGDALAVDDTGLECLKRRTIAAALAELDAAELVERAGDDGSGAGLWRATARAKESAGTDRLGDEVQLAF